MLPSPLRRLTVTFAAVAAGLLLTGTAAQADPLWPGGPDIPGIPPLFPAPPIVLPPQPQLLPSTVTAIEPANGAVVGGKQVIDVRFRDPVLDRTGTANAVTVDSSAGVGTNAVWIDDRHLQFEPDDYWPRGTTVTVDAPGMRSSFSVSNKFTALADGASHQFSASIGGDVVRTMPASLGRAKYPTPNGTFTVSERLRTTIFDSSTIGIPVDAPDGYRLTGEYAVRITWGGVFVHSAPWSVADQGNRNVSHGCINLSEANAKWFFDNVRVGDTVTVRNG